MRLTARDFRLLSGFGRHRVLTLKQVQRYYFGGAGRNNVHERLSQLRSINLLRSFPFGEHGELAWTITSDAARELGLPPYMFKRPPNLNNLPHDLVVAEVGLRLEELGVLHDWVSSYELQSRAFKPGVEAPRVPDASFRLKRGDKIVGPISLEVENTHKSLGRIQKRLDDYIYQNKTTDLWFLWREDWMGRTLKKLPRDNKRPFGAPPLRVWVGTKSYNEELDLTLEGPGDEVFDVVALAQLAIPKVQAPLQAAVLEQESVVPNEVSDESSFEIERLRARCTPNSDGLLTRDIYPYPSMSGVDVTAGPLENGVQGTKEVLEGDEGMTRGIKGLENGVQG